MQKENHNNIQKANFGSFSRNEIAILGTPCDEITILFDLITSKLSNYRFGVIEADHKAEETLHVTKKYTDKINFQRLDSNFNINNFDKRVQFDDVDLLLINGNHFDGNQQILVIDTKKSLDKKIEKFTNVKLILLKEGEISEIVKEKLGPNIPILNWNETDQIIAFIEKLIEEQKPKLHGLVLMGGKSTRMGTDKSKLDYQGKPQNEYAFDLLSKYCDGHVFLSINEKNLNNNGNNLPTISDKYLGLGPLGGILSAFQFNPNVAWLVIAVDMPYVTDKSLNQLVSHRNTSKIATTFKSPFDDFPEPLITIWEPRAYPKLLQMLAFGYDCPRKTLINFEVEILINEKEKELTNVNYPNEFEKALIDLSIKLV